MDGVKEQPKLVFRDPIREDRGNWYIEYRPADVRSFLAFAQITYPNDISELESVAETMEQELRTWLQRYPVPTMVTSFDRQDDVIRLGRVRPDSHLTGFVDDKSGEIVSRWGTVKDEEFPSAQRTPIYQETIYRGVPFRFQEEVRRKAIREGRNTARVARTIVLLTFGIPILIEIVSLGSVWIGLIVSGISISWGLYELAKAMRWVKATKRDLENAEKKRKMEHYFYHCEQNPDAFNKLKAENFTRDVIKKTQAEAQALWVRKPPL